jgi:hypothetical protein
MPCRDAIRAARWSYLQVSVAVALEAVSVRTAGTVVAPTQVATPAEGSVTLTVSEVISVATRTICGTAHPVLPGAA